MCHMKKLIIMFLRASSVVFDVLVYREGAPSRYLSDCVPCISKILCLLVCSLLDRHI